MSLNYFQQNMPLVNSIVSIIFFLAIFFVRFITLRGIDRHHWASLEDKRRWVVTTRNLCFLIFLFGLLVIWATELRAIALSLAALAVAIVLATKEIILCISGGALRASARAFSVGDRIEIEGLRGDVVDTTLFVTTLLEVGPGQTSHQYSGRSITFPNSLLLASPVINETYTDDFVLHPFTIPMHSKDNWKRAEEILLRISKDECHSFLADAQKHMDRIAIKRGLDVPSAEPRVTLHFPEPGRVDLLVRIPTPARKKGKLEQSILRKFMEEFHAN